MSKTTFVIILMFLLVLAIVAFIGGFMISKSIHEHKTAQPIVIHTTPAMREKQNLAEIAGMENEISIEKQAQAFETAHSPKKAVAVVSKKKAVEASVPKKGQKKAAQHVSDAEKHFHKLISDGKNKGKKVVAKKEAPAHPALKKDEPVKTAHHTAAVVHKKEPVKKPDTRPKIHRGPLHTPHKPKALVITPSLVAAEINDYGGDLIAEEIAWSGDVVEWRRQKYHQTGANKLPFSSFQSLENVANEQVERTEETQRITQENKPYVLTTRRFSEAYDLVLLYRKEGLDAEIHKHFDRTHQPWYSVYVKPRVGANASQTLRGA